MKKFNKITKISASQNFLNSENIIRKLLYKSNINKNDIVYDLGAGKGIITKELSKISKKVIAVELDKILYDNLLNKFYKANNICIIWNDILKIDFKTQSKIFANIPFNITSELIDKIVLNKKISDAYLTMEKGAYLRLFGIIGENFKSLFYKPLIEISKIYNFNRNNFTPATNIDVVFIHIHKKENIEIDINAYKLFLKNVFITKGITIKQKFKNVLSYNQLKRLGKEFNFDINSDIKTLTYPQYLGIFNYYAQFQIK